MLLAGAVSDKHLTEPPQGNVMNWSWSPMDRPTQKIFHYLQQWWAALHFLDIEGLTAKSRKSLNFSTPSTTHTKKHGMNESLYTPLESPTLGNNINNNNTQLNGSFTEETSSVKNSQSANKNANKRKGKISCKVFRHIPSICSTITSLFVRF